MQTVSPERQASSPRWALWCLASSHLFEPHPPAVRAAQAGPHWGRRFAASRNDFSINLINETKSNTRTRHCAATRPLTDRPLIMATCGTPRTQLVRAPRHASCSVSRSHAHRLAPYTLASMAAHMFACGQAAPFLPKNHQHPRPPPQVPAIVTGPNQSHSAVIVHSFCDSLIQSCTALILVVQDSCGFPDY